MTHRTPPEAISRLVDTASTAALIFFFRQVLYDSKTNHERGIRQVARKCLG
jgi:hypothetical protein